MTVNIPDALTAQLKRRPSVSRDVISAASRAVGIEFPDDYTDFMSSSDGGTGPVGSSGYLVLWPVEELAEMNNLYKVKQYAPGLVLFGTDGGDMAYAFDGRTRPTGVVEVPFIPMDLDEARYLGHSLLELLSSLARR